MYCVNTLKRELNDTYAYKLQAYLNESANVDEHVVMQPYILVSKIKSTKEMFLRYTGCLKLYEARFIANCSSCKAILAYILLLSKMLLSTAKKYTKYPVRIYSGILDIQEKLR